MIGDEIFDGALQKWLQLFERDGGVTGQDGLDHSFYFGVEFLPFGFGGLDAGAGFMRFLFASFGGLAAGFLGTAGCCFRGFEGGAAFLRFEANLGFALFGSQFAEFGEAFVEGAVVGGLVAQEEVQGFEALFGILVGIQGVVEEEGGAPGGPIVLGHFGDEDFLGDGGGVVLGAKVGEERFVVGLGFVGHDAEGSGEAESEIVGGRGGFAGVGFGAGAELGVELVGGDLRGG